MCLKFQTIKKKKNQNVDVWKMHTRVEIWELKFDII